MIKLIRRIGISLFLGWALLLLIVLALEEDSWARTTETLLKNTTSLLSAWQFWVYIVLIGVVAEVVRYLKRVFVQKGGSIFFKRFLQLLVFPIGALVLLFFLSQWYVSSEDYDYRWDRSVENGTGQVRNNFERDGKQRGIHVFGRIDSVELRVLSANNVEWITLTPFLYQDKVNGRLAPLPTNREQSSRDSIFINKIVRAHEAGFKVFLKPHIWLTDPNGQWRSDIHPTGNAWTEWSKNYREHLLHLATLAEKHHVELFCIGTELSELSTMRPKFWNGLIRDIRHRYSGPLTYAANWDMEYKNIGFWKELDFVGIQAYFPISNREDPDIGELQRKWKRHGYILKRMVDSLQRPILFTELGYKSTGDAARSPWRWLGFMERFTDKASLRTQAQAYQAFFDTIWKEHWFAGVHFWKWETGRSLLLLGRSHDFTPRDKPAQNIMATGFSKIHPFQKHWHTGSFP